MSLGGVRDGNLFETNMSLRCEIKSLKRTIEEYKKTANDILRSKLEGASVEDVPERGKDHNTFMQMGRF